ncbi:hypothetical protein ACFL1H_06510 [Nanoarchaeota archaeon]
MIVQIDPKLLIYDRSFQQLCKKPYYGHSKGCPNFGKKEGCPPSPLLDDVFDLGAEMFVIYTSFNVGEFAEKMRVSHPEWQNHPRQWYNPRRWQPKARKEHKIELEKFISEYGLDIDKCPEARGINVSRMMMDVSVDLSWGWPPEHNLSNLTYIVSVGGSKL